MTTTLQVRKDRLSETRVVREADQPLAAGQVRVRIDRLALTANNITYAAFGEAMNYWQFFPTGDAAWGVIPAWGFGTVVQSLQPGIHEGERLYGYWPLADSAVLQPGRVSSAGFSDAAAHREPLHALYNQYLRCSADPFQGGASEDVQALLRPLFTTSWLIDDFLADQDFFGADTVLLSSASSKTAWGTAFQLRERGAVQVVGLTSPGRVADCEALGLYDRVLAYGQLDALDPATACVYVDFAGNAALRRDIHQRFAGLRYSCSVGGTHVEQLGGGRDLPGPRPTLFFAPAQARKRQQDWGGAVLADRLLQGWRSFSAFVAAGDRPLLRVREHAGFEAAAAVYQQVLAGRGESGTGDILRLAA